MIGSILLLSTIFAAGGENMIFKYDIETYRLKNGLTIFLLEDHTLPIVAVNVNYNVGSKNEVRGKTGFAHLFEHIMFQGSKHFNDDYFKALQDIGGEVNGATNQDRTRYYEIIPSNYLERALWLESDRMGFLLDALTDERLKNQKSVVINEYRQNYENRPYGMVYFEILKHLFPPHHPYSWPTIGLPEDVNNATMEDVKNFFKTYYGVNNATIAIAGDINKEETKKLVEKYFGSFKPAKPIKYISRWSPKLNETKRINMRDKVNLPRLYIAYPSAAVFEEYDAELDIIAKVLGENENSRLYKILVKDEKIASEVSAYQSSNQIAGYFVITATLYPDKDIIRARDLIIKEVEKIAKVGVTTQELEQAKNYFKSDYIKSLKRFGGFGGITDRMNYYYQMLGNPNMFEYDLNRYMKASNTTISKAAKKYLNQNYLEIIVEPQKELYQSKNDIDRTRMPESREEKDITFPKAIHTEVAGGNELYIYPYQRLPLNYLSVIIPAGSSLDGDKPGLADFTASLLLTGTKGLTNEEIQSKLDLLGSTISYYADQDSTIIITTFLSEKAEETLKLLSDILFNPRFDQKEIELQKLRMQNTLLRLYDQPQFISSLIFAKQYFRDHPYGHLPLGEINFYKSVNRNDIVKFYNEKILKSKPKIAFTGKLKEDEIKSLIKRYLLKFKSSEDKKSTKIIRKENPSGTRIFLADKPLSTQSHIQIIFKGIMRTDSKFESAYITNTIFGGYFLSRLNMRLREEKGFTYGARSFIKYYINDSVWIATTSVQADATDDTIKETINVIKEMKKDELLKDEEIKSAKGYVVKSFPIEYETIDSLHSKLTNIALFNLPVDIINQEYNKLKNVTKENIRDIAKEFFDDENLMIIVVGDKKRILEQLKSLNINIVEITTTGEVIK